MPSLRFEWDPAKSRRHVRKHSVSFDEARTVFFDEHGLLLADPDHGEDEQRFVLLGLSALARLLIVCHCYRDADDVIRIISARKANRRERHQYAQRSVS